MTLLRLFHIVASAGLIASIALPCLAADDPPRFVVHEWGVMVMGRSEAGTELGPPERLPAGLPPFVLRHDAAYKPKRQDHGWDKPVIYFYGPEGLRVNAAIGTPLGKPVAYWPPPDGYQEVMGKMIMDRRAMMAYTLSAATGLRWDVTLSDKPAREPAAVEKGQWWADARDVPAAWVNTKSGSERFLFYEATARQEPAVRGIVADDALTLRNTGDAASGPVLVLVNDGTTRRGRVVPTIAAGASERIAKEALAEEWTNERTLAEAASQWRAMGMTREEADAIVKVWRPDLLNTVGFLVIARMPPAAYDRMFPLSLNPRPDELVRVALVFDVLAGQDARAGWLPALRPTLDGYAKMLSAGDFRQREEAAAKFERMGDLARPYLKSLAASADPETSRAVALILQKMEPVTPASRPATRPAER